MEKKFWKYKVFIEGNIKKKYGQGAHIVAEYDYYDGEGNYAYTKVRFEGGNIKGKEMRYYIIDRSKDHATLGKGSYKGCALYNIEAVQDAIKNGYPVYYVEGEKDVDTLKKYGIPATTAGSVGDWNSSLKTIFKGATLRIVPDNDVPGKQLAEKIARDVKGFAYCVQIVELVIKRERDDESIEEIDLPPHGDVSDYFAQGGSLKLFREQAKKSKKTYAPWCDIKPKADDDDPVVINHDKLAMHIRQNEHYLLVRAANDDKDLYYTYKDGYYQNVNTNSFCSFLIMPYIPLGKAGARTAGQILSLVQQAHDQHVVAIEELNADGRYINVRNGLLNVQTGIVEPHNPGVKTTWQVPVTYTGAAPTPRIFTKYMDDLLTDCSGKVDREIEMVLQEVIGLLLSNIPFYKIKKCVCLLSNEGNTGKSQIIKLIQYLLGLNNIISTDLLDMDPTRSKGRFALGQLMGKRAILVGDQSMGAMEDSSVLKRLTGGDATEMESKHKAQQYHVWPGGIFICCNRMPVIKDDQGKHIYERLLIIELFHTIAEKDRDPDILDKMIAECDGIFVWAFKGLQRLINNNFRLTYSSAVEAAIDKYRADVDVLYNFLVNSYDITFAPGDRIRASDLEDAFFYWYRQSELYKNLPFPKKNDIRKKMASYGIPTDRARISGDISGVTVYVGIRPKNNVRRNNDKITSITEYKVMRSVS